MTEENGYFVNRIRAYVNEYQISLDGKLSVEELTDMAIRNYLENDKAGYPDAEASELALKSAFELIDPVTESAGGDK